MAGIGEFHVLSEGELKAAFDRAKGENKDFLVKIEFTSQGVPMGMAGIPVLLEMIDFHQAAHGVGRESAADDLRAIYRRYGSLCIRGVYDLAAPFDAAAKGDETLLPQEALQTVRAEIDRERHDAALAARPLWKRLLGLKP